MSCRILQDISAASRQCPSPSAPYGASTSPCRGGFGKPPPGRLPCKGLRSRAPPAADTARRSRCSGRRMQARFSVRRMMRIPQTGNGVSRLRGAAPCPANTLPGCLKPPRPCGAALTQNHSAPFAILPGGRSRPPYNITYTCNGAGSGSLPPCVGADARIGPPTGTAKACRFRITSRSRPQCRAGVFARRLGPSAAARFRDNASIVPYGSIRQGPARRCRISPPQGGNAPLRLRRTAHPPPLAGEALQTASPQKAPLRKHTASPRPDPNRGPTGRTLIPHSQFLIPNSTSPPPLPSPP